MSHMLSDTNDALSPVVVFAIFNDRNPEWYWSVAHVSVAPPVFPSFQNAGIIPSKPPISVIVGMSSFSTVRSSQ